MNTLDSMVSDTSIVRIIDAFVSNINLKTLGFQTTTNPTDHGLLESTASKLKEDYFKIKP